jgi:translation initiation factor IF-2
MATTRVYILSKELGVKSAAIVKKCQDENLDVKNHMSTISAGLAATIREWFSEGQNITTVETAEKVDLKKVRAKKKKKKKAAPKRPQKKP